MGTLLRTKHLFISISLVKLIIHIENIVENYFTGYSRSVSDVTHARRNFLSREGGVHLIFKVI